MEPIRFMRWRQNDDFTSKGLTDKLGAGLISILQFSFKLVYSKSTFILLTNKTRIVRRALFMKIRTIISLRSKVWISNRSS